MWRAKSYATGSSRSRSRTVEAAWFLAHREGRISPGKSGLLGFETPNNASLLQPSAGNGRGFGLDRLLAGIAGVDEFAAGFGETSAVEGRFWIAPAELEYDL
jgi:hypothetical protein